MQYEPLRSIYYQDSEKYYAEYEKRIHSADVVFFPIEIGEQRTFLVPNWEMTTLMESIGRMNAASAEVFTFLPGAAQEYYQDKCLFEEIQMTNDIEGIHSTRKEIAEALAPQRKDRTARFAGMAKKYAKLKLQHSDLDIIPLDDARDIRKLYDEFVSAEIEPENQPDGVIFRKGEVFVVSPTQQQRHAGILPEEKIISAMESALHILEKKELPILVRIAIFHYFFGYIHPFYDGNGRMSRFISSYLLRKNQFPLLALELSYTIKENRKKYYHAFQICNDEKNRGDITPFVIYFLELMNSASERMCKNLFEGRNKFVKYDAIVKSLFTEERKQELFSFFIQNALFVQEPFTSAELEALLNCSRTTLDKLLNSLIEEGYPIEKVHEGRLNKYSLDIEKFEEKIEKAQSKTST